MSYRFRRGESIAEGVQRIVGEQSRRVVEHFSAPTDRVLHVHSARQGLKRLRGLLRLIRPALPRHLFHEANQLCRDLARSVSGSRDAAVALATFDDLVKDFLPLEAGAVGQVRAALVRYDQDHQAVEPGGDGSLPLDDLLALAGRLAEVKLPKHRWEDLGRGFRRTYARGQEAMRQAFAHPRDELFHQWRKRVKDRWYQVLLLRSSWKPIMLSLAEELKRLADLLGLDHDLTVLNRLVQGELAGELGEGLRNLLGERIAEKQTQLRRESRRLGQCLYSEKAKRNARRLGTYWQAWKRRRGRRKLEPALEYAI